MNGSLRNKIKRVACIACASLSLGGFNVSKSNAMSKGAKAGIITGSIVGGAGTIVGVYFLVRWINRNKMMRNMSELTNQSTENIENNNYLINNNNNIQDNFVYDNNENNA